MAVQKVGGGQSRGGEKGKSDVDFPENAADNWASDEADAECGTHETEIARPVLGRRDIGEIGIGRSYGRAKHAGYQPSGKQPPVVRCER